MELLFYFLFSLCIPDIPDAVWLQPLPVVPKGSGVLKSTQTALGWDLSQQCHVSKETKSFAAGATQRAYSFSQALLLHFSTSSQK